jgi:predicted metalloprotease
MKWRGRRSSTNIEDRRGRRVSRGAATGGVGTIVILLVAIYFGMDPGVVLDNVATGPSPASVEPYVPNAAEQELAQMIGVVLADTEDTWHELFRRGGATYQEPQLVLFTGAAESACGFAQAAMGPFYCGADRKVYIDLSFYQQLRDRFRAPGDFAQAYVVAHEVGHHVQQLLGISDQVRAEKSRSSQNEANALSVRQELQADCLAGVWAAYADRARGMLESGDIEEGLRAAAAIGDDNIQRQTQGRVVPESFTHGSSEQRVRWFRVGLESGSMESCDTFAQSRL